MAAARKRYWVDWTDQPFPKITLWNFEGVEHGPDALTLGEAKREIVQHFTYQIQHARMMIRDTKALRARDIEGHEDQEKED